MMPRGGKREGAGRKPSLDPEMIQMIRRDCEQRANVLRQKQAEHLHKRTMAKRGVVRGKIMRLESTQERKAVIRFGIDEPDNNHFPESLSEPARAAIDFMREKRKWFGRYPLRLPGLAKGRDEIIAQVASDWELSERMIRSIWESAPAV
jgi:hypothetical protein